MANHLLSGVVSLRDFFPTVWPKKSAMSWSGWSVSRFVQFIRTSFPYNRLTNIKYKNIHSLQGYSTAIDNGENFLCSNPNKNYPTNPETGQSVRPQLKLFSQNLSSMYKDHQTVTIKEKHLSLRINSTSKTDISGA